MNANTPYAGLPGVTPPGERAPEDVSEVTPEQHRALREHVSEIASLTREYLPHEYAIGAEVRRGATGPEATVAVEPPVGHPVSAGLSPELNDIEDLDVDASEVARGLAATAALQVKQAMDGHDLAAR
ncbi:hypothetical protein BRC81_04670 [Halobacteriales archaeon QS_1_68_20]|nr:MAG: hypothetical protein BRC81_04670 [Halobacteriales archaeon QS_1_68_20]